MRNLKALQFLLGMLGSGCCQTVTNTALSVPLPTANADSAIIDPDFCGFAFEEASFHEYALDSSGNVNAFSLNLIDAITSRSGGKPLIRLGGTSADFAKYLPGQVEDALPVAAQNTYQDIGGTTIGPSYWELCDSFPGAQYIVQVPLATTNISEAVAWAKSAVDTIGWDRIYAIELGNEPDLYPNTGAGGVLLKPPNYQGKLTNATYVGNFTEYVSAIAEAVDLPDRPIFQAFDEAENSFDLATCFSHGIDNNTISTVAHHYYQGTAGNASTLSSGLMTMSLTHSNLDKLTGPISWLKQNRPDIPFILSEVGNSLYTTNSYQFQARLGSALWQVDFYLYAMSIGVARINYQQIMHAGYDLWLPIASAGLEAQVFANYYSQPFVADFIGTSGETTVQKLTITGGQSRPNLAGYAAFEAGKLKRVAFANLQYWNQSSSGTERPEVLIDLAVPTGVTKVIVDRLGSPLGAGADSPTITYAGSQWTYANQGKEIKGVRNDSETIQVLNGIATISVSDSEAILVSL